MIISKAFEEIDFESLMFLSDCYMMLLYGFFHRFSFSIQSSANYTNFWLSLLVSAKFVL